jgi:two-component system NarL family sensor kinase
MMTAGRRRLFVVVVRIEGEVGRRLIVVLAWAVWLLAPLGLAAVAWFDHLERQAGNSDLALLDASSVPFMVAALSAATVGAVLASRRPRHPVGWLLLAVGLSVIAIGFTAAYATYGLPAYGLPAYGLPAWPGSLLAAHYALAYQSVGMVPLAVCLGFILLLTPTGSLPSPRWRWWARVTAAAPVIALATLVLLPFEPEPFESTPNPLAISVLEGPLRFLNRLTWVIGGLAVLVAAGSLVVRFRYARGVERQQLRWVVFAGMLTGMTMLATVATILVMVAGIATPPPILLGWLVAVGVALLPAAIGVAILRYRLYDLDYLISRTVVYGLLTAGGIAVYVGVVKLAERLLREGVGLGGSLLATAVIAIGFAPARDRLQRWADRRLYGERHDPVQAMARLGERLRDAPGGAPGGDALAGVLQAVCEALRLPAANLLVDNVEVASFGRSGTASEAIPLAHEGQQVGALLVSPRTGEQTLGPADRQVLEVLAAPVAVALHAVLLSQELQRSRERLVAAREEERRRLRRDLHDGLGPTLTAVTLKADAARSVLAAAPDRADGLLAELRGDAKQAIGDLRRVIYDLRPAALDELGLLGALSEQVDRFARQGLSVTLQAPPALPVLPAAVEVAAYRIVTEALTNIARHAHAHQVTITVAIDGDLCLAVQDDGTASTANGDGWRPGTGLQSMAERAAEVGGTLQAGPTPTGGRVRVSLPLEGP